MRNVNQRIFVSDCEGPISKNDNAFELTSHFVPDGSYFFQLISKYDDILSDVIKKPGYKAGETLKLILPFLKAYGATNKTIKEYSSKNISLFSGARDTLQFVKGIMPSFIVSTSYEQYLSSLCDLVDFPFERVYCTRLDLDKYEFNEENKKLKELRQEIAAFTMIKIPKGADSISDFSKKDQKTIRRLDGIFWEEIPKMKCGKIFEEVNPMGGDEKANALKDIAERIGSNLCDVVYVGDGITDVSPFQLVRRNGGLTVSFNGNKYAISEAEVAVLSDNMIVLSILADVFNRFGKDYVIKLVEEWDYSTLKKYLVNVSLRDHISRLYPETIPQVELITKDNKKRLMVKSSRFRKTVRGKIIGKLG